MHALQRLIPDPDVLLALSPEELGGKILFAIRTTPSDFGRGLLNAYNLLLEFDQYNAGGFQSDPASKISQVKQAFLEAWMWLESQGLVVWAYDQDGQNGWRRLSRRATKFEVESEYLTFVESKNLRQEMLHPLIAKDVWLDFARGKFDVAIFQAMKALEIAVRSKSGLPETDYGVPLMRKAFHVENGPLTDKSEQTSEREALLTLFAGTIGRFKNPQSHRNVGVQDARDAIEVILLANHLLKILDSRPVQTT